MDPYEFTIPGSPLETGQEPPIVHPSWPPQAREVAFQTGVSPLIPLDNGVIAGSPPLPLPLFETGGNFETVDRTISPNTLAYIDELNDALSSPPPLSPDVHAAPPSSPKHAGERVGFSHQYDPESELLELQHSDGEVDEELQAALQLSMMTESQEASRGRDKAQKWTESRLLAPTPIKQGTISQEGLWAEREKKLLADREEELHRLLCKSPPPGESLFTWASNERKKIIDRYAPKLHSLLWQRDNITSPSAMAEREAPARPSTPYQLIQHSTQSPEEASTSRSSAWKQWVRVQAEINPATSPLRVPSPSL